MGQSSVSNMQFPTEAWQSANQSANNMYLQGKKALAEGVTKGTEGITGYLKQQKQIKTGNDAAIKFMESPQGAQMLGLAPEQTQMFKEISANMGTEEKSKAIQMFLQQASMAQTQKQKLEQINAEGAATLGWKTKLAAFENSLIPKPQDLEPIPGLSPANPTAPAGQPQGSPSLPLPVASGPPVATFPDPLIGGAMQSSGTQEPTAAPFAESDLALIGNNQPAGSMYSGGGQTLTQASPAASYAPPVQQTPQQQQAQQEKSAPLFPADDYKIMRDKQTETLTTGFAAIDRNARRLPKERGATYAATLKSGLEYNNPKLPSNFLEYDKGTKELVNDSISKVNAGRKMIKDIDSILTEFNKPMPSGFKGTQEDWDKQTENIALARAQAINPNALGDKERTNLMRFLNENNVQWQNFFKKGLAMWSSDREGFKRQLHGMGNAIVDLNREYHNNIALASSPEYARVIAVEHPGYGDGPSVPVITRESGPDLKRAAQLEQERRGKKSGGAPATAPASAPSRPMPQSNSIYTIRPSAK